MDDFQASPSKSQSSNPPVEDNNKVGYSTSPKPVSDPKTNTVSGINRSFPAPPPVPKKASPSKPSQMSAPQIPPFPKTEASSSPILGPNTALDQLQTTANEPEKHESPGFTQKEIKPISLKTYAKLGFILILLASTISGSFLIIKNVSGQTTPDLKGDILFQTRYQPVLWKDFGEVFEPIVKIPLYYPDKGYSDHEFLLDSGALVSSLPREEAKKMNLSLAKLQRSTFGGFGGTTSFAYKGEAKIKLGEQEVQIPVVFTEAGGTKSILGRSGFFEKYSINFNATKEMIEIRK